MYSSPVEHFKAWFDQAKDAGIPHFDAMTLVTATTSARPSARIVLLRGLEGEEFRFYTNYESRKSRELMENSQAQLLFYWPQLGHQIRIEGRAKKLSAEDSDAYWFTRPRESRIGAIASHQSRTLESMEELIDRVKDVEQLHEGKEVTRPENWGGWGLTPSRFEFWKDGAYRLHERITFERGAAGEWVTGRLYP